MRTLVNPAIASQSLAIAGQAVNGGSTVRRMGHPLGCTGTKLSVQLFNEMRRRKQKYGVVTILLGRDRLCVGTGQGAASVFELLN